MEGSSSIFWRRRLIWTSTLRAPSSEPSGARSARVTGQYQGDHARIKDSVNATGQALEEAGHGLRVAHVVPQPGEQLAPAGREGIDPGAVLLEADALVLLSDVDALYTSPPSMPSAQKISKVAFDDNLETIEIGDTSTGVGTGGAMTKVSAAKLANAAGVPVLLTSAQNVSKALSAEDVGTWFEAKK